MCFSSFSEFCKLSFQSRPFVSAIALFWACIFENMPGNAWKGSEAILPFTEWLWALYRSNSHQVFPRDCWCCIHRLEEDQETMPIDVLLMSNCKNDCHWSNSPACRVSAAEGRKECKVRGSNVAKAEQVETFPRALETLETVHVNTQTVWNCRIRKKVVTLLMSKIV